MKVVVVYSGGLDSTTLLYQLIHDGHEVHALSVNYGQRHNRELAAAAEICMKLRVPWQCADLSGLSNFMGGSSQTDPTVDVPDGHYADESMKITVVPNRNMILLAVAGAWAVAIEAYSIAFAAHAGDHTIYPDCRPEFVELAEACLLAGNWHQVLLTAPFIAITKTDIARRAIALGVPIALTWSCYKGGDVHCGTCGTCTERREALAGLDDPTEYAQ